MPRETYASSPVYVTTHIASVVARLRSEYGRREWRRLLECSDFDHAAAWRAYVARACPTLPRTYFEDVIDGARRALMADRRPRIRRVRRAA
jgi:hypothetical protein